MQPLTFFFALRNPTEDPTEAQWEKVKEKWPVLAGRSDAELKEALGPIKAVKVDFRSLKAEKKASSRFRRATMATRRRCESEFVEVIKLFKSLFTVELVYRAREERIDDAREVESAAAIRLMLCVKLGREAAHSIVDARLLCDLHRQAQILAHQIDHKPGWKPLLAGTPSMTPGYGL